MITIPYIRFANGVWMLLVLAAIPTLSSAKTIPIQNGRGTVSPPEFEGAIINLHKGFREYKPNGYGLVERQYIKWSDIELGADDSVERIIAHTNQMTNRKGKPFEGLSVKLIPRVYLDWTGETGASKKHQHWPAGRRS